jgi:starch phosphorylase
MNHAYFPRILPTKLEPLVDLVLDLRWTWSHTGDTLWQYMDADIWEQTQNPWLVLQSISHDRLNALCSDKRFLDQLELLLAERENYHTPPDWFTSKHADCELCKVAYFRMAYGLGEALPLYAGGLGILAGDHLKAASDLGVPIVALGLFYQRGYFRQLVDDIGWQHEFYPYNDPVSLPIRPATEEDGDWLHIHLPLPGRELILRVWEVQIGPIKLYLLDSNDPMNSPVDRGITGELYVGGSEMRLLQEITLGFGGWRVLTAMGIKPEVLHLNEGHTAFAALGRIRDFAERHDTDFEEALWSTRAGNIFTTHTPVAAGFDCFPPALVSQYMHEYAKSLQVPAARLIELAMPGPGENDKFNMAYLAMRLCARINGVSRLHGDVSRRLFQPLFPRWPHAEVPVGHVTNGIHTPSWDSACADLLWTDTCGKERWLGALEMLRENIEAIPNDTLWTFRSEGRYQLITFVRQRLERQLGTRGADQREIARARSILDPNTMTVGFARRFAVYKRPDLLLRDENRLIRLLAHPARPVQLVIAGKAHPEDTQGKRMIQRWVQFAQRPEICGRVVFLGDYDMALAEQLTQGVDLWINTPRRPLEACGTSGMKVLVNGGLNLSALDGWWAEAHNPDVGWKLDTGDHLSETDQDRIDAEQLYRLLEDEVVPCFYNRDRHGIAVGWVARIRASMAALTPQYSANRMLREHLENYYLPAAIAYRTRTSNDGRVAKSLAQWHDNIQQHWDNILFQNLSVDTRGSTHHFTVQIYLDSLSPDMVTVEIFADAQGDQEPYRKDMRPTGTIPGAMNGYIYEADVVSDRPACHYTPRIVPTHADARIPCEEAHIMWLE